MFGIFFSDIAKKLFGAIGNLLWKFILNSSTKNITHAIIILNFIQCFVFLNYWLTNIKAVIQLLLHALSLKSVRILTT